MWFLGIFLMVVLASSSHIDEWNTFKNGYGKTYRSAREESLRFAIFEENLRKIQVHNKRYENAEVSYKMGVNQFTDLTEEEIENQWKMPEFHSTGAIGTFEAEHDDNPATSVDWRKKGAVLGVLNQGSCGSCYAFSGVGAIEGQVAIKHNVRKQLSEQEVVDCAKAYWAKGCHGGWMTEVYSYARDNGLALLNDYKYEADEGACRNSSYPKADVKVTGYKLVEPNGEALRQAVEKVGPISITLYHNPMFSYKEGIFDINECPNWPTHAVLVVGYGTENGVDYWIIKNSLGDSWGENGYIRVKRTPKGLCGMYDHPMYPIIA